jgi:hypothetical protein
MIPEEISRVVLAESQAACQFESEPMVIEGVSQEQIRCFVAIEIPETIQNLLISVQDELKTKIRGAS